MFGNPVPGVILEKKAPWPGAPVFRVTATFADHIAGKRPPGIDIGNGRRGDAVLAVADGVIVAAFRDPNGALIVRQRTMAYTGYMVGYAHLARYVVSVGQTVKRGQTIGAVGDTGAPGQPHLHWGVNLNGREVDGWPLLDQNKENDVDQHTLTDRYPFPEGTRTWTANGGKVTGYKSNGDTKVVDLKAGSKAQAKATANIFQSPQKAPNGHGFVEIANGALAGYFVLGTAGKLDPAPKVYTQAELDAAEQAAVDAAQAQANRT